LLACSTRHGRAPSGRSPSRTTRRKNGPDEQRRVRRRLPEANWTVSLPAIPVKERTWRVPPKQVLDGGLAWNFHVPRRPLYPPRHGRTSGTARVPPDDGPPCATPATPHASPKPPPRAAARHRGTSGTSPHHPMLAAGCVANACIPARRACPRIAARGDLTCPKTELNPRKVVPAGRASGLVLKPEPAARFHTSLNLVCLNLWRVRVHILADDASETQSAAEPRLPAEAERWLACLK
jgi:hypothetical protein